MWYKKSLMEMLGFNVPMDELAMVSIMCQCVLRRVDDYILRS